jgi:hypothetical protein
VTIRQGSQHSPLSQRNHFVVRGGMHCWRYVVSLSSFAMMAACAGNLSRSEPANNDLAAESAPLPNQAEINTRAHFNGTYRGEGEVFNDFETKSFTRSFVVFVDTADAQAVVITGSSLGPAPSGAFVLMNVPITGQSISGTTDLRHARFVYELKMDAHAISKRSRTSDEKRSSVPTYLPPPISFVSWRSPEDDPTCCSTIRFDWCGGGGQDEKVVEY